MWYELFSGDRVSCGMSCFVVLEYRVIFVVLWCYSIPLSIVSVPDML